MDFSLRSGFMCGDSCHTHTTKACYYSQQQNVPVVSDGFNLYLRLNNPISNFFIALLLTLYTLFKL